MKVIKPIIYDISRSQILIELSLKDETSTQLGKTFNKNQSGIHQQILDLRLNKWLINKNEPNYAKLTEEFIKYCREDIILSNTLKVSEQEKEVVKSIIKYSLQRCAELGYHKKKGFTISHLFNILKIKMFIDDDLREVTPVF